MRNTDDEITLVIHGKTRNDPKPRRRAADVFRCIPEIRESLSKISGIHFEKLDLEDQYSLILHLNRIADVLSDIKAAADIAEKRKA